MINVKFSDGLLTARKIKQYTPVNKKKKPVVEEKYIAKKLKPKGLLGQDIEENNGSIA